MSKIIAITGANSGIGLAAAKLLAGQGHEIILICRSEVKGQAALAEVKEAVSGVKASLFLCDLGKFETVVEAAEQIKGQFQHLDVLLNNAGYYPPEVGYTEGVEHTLYASHLGHMLLTLRLMPLLEASSEARIVNVSSAAHQMGKTERFFKQLDKYSNIQAYGDAKLANILLSLGLTTRTKPHITSYSLHPGVVGTNFGDNLPAFFRGFFNLTKSFLFLSPEKGAATSVHLASAPIAQLKGHNGEYFAKRKPQRMKHRDVTGEKADWLWEKSMGYIQEHL